MSLSRVREKSVEGYIEVLRRNAEEVESAELKERLGEACDELTHLVPVLEESGEREHLLREFGELQNALASCEDAGEAGLRCMPFFERILRLTRECWQLAY